MAGSSYCTLQRNHLGHSRHLLAATLSADQAVAGPAAKGPALTCIHGTSASNPADT